MTNEGEKLKSIGRFRGTPVEELTGQQLLDYEEFMNIKTRRPTWDEYFMNIMNQVASRATCDRGRSGAVITMDNHILVTGYVGSPKGLPHCDDVGHLMKKTVDENGKMTEGCQRTIHAETNAICQAANLGIPLSGSTLYCRMTPCARICAPMIINCGIKVVVCERKYRLFQETHDMFEAAGVSIEYVHDEIQKYEGESDAN